MTPLHLEDMVGSSIPGAGFREDQCPGVGGWRTAAGLTLTASTTPALTTLATSHQVMLWAAADTFLNAISINITMPFQFATERDDLQIVCVARKADTGGDENPDLALAANLFWFAPGTVSTPDIQSLTATAPTLTAGDTALNTLTTPARALMVGVDVAATTSNLIGFGTYVIDIGRQLRAESTLGHIEAGAPVKILFGPHEDVGSADMAVHFFSPIVRMRRHSGLWYDLTQPGRSPR